MSENLDRLSKKAILADRRIVLAAIAWSKLDPDDPQGVFSDLEEEWLPVANQLDCTLAEFCDSIIRVVKQGVSSNEPEIEARRHAANYPSM